MVYTTNNLISDAFHASGVVSREFETVNGSQIAEGLQWLNDILADKGVDQGMLPFESTYNFIAQIGVEKYFIPNLTQIDTLVFFLDKVRYAMKYTARNQYFGSTRVENINSLPYEWYFERQQGGGNLYLYFRPDKNYPVEIHGSFELDSVQLGQNLSANETVADLGVPTFYYNSKQLFSSSVEPVFSLDPGQLVISTVNQGQITSIDLMGTYENIGALLNYINSGVLPGVMAQIVVNDFQLISTTSPPNPIYVQTTGYPTVGTPTGTKFIGNVAVATTANLVASSYNNGNLGIGATLQPPLPNTSLFIDGYVVQLNDRVLVKNQTDPTQNGSYILTQQAAVGLKWILTRTTNYDEPKEIGIGNLFTVVNGGANGSLTFVQTQVVNVIGTSPISFVPFGAVTFSNFSTIQTFLYDIFSPGGFENFYTSYLRYALAHRICAEYCYDIPPNVQKMVTQYEAWIKKKSKTLDLSLEKSSTLQRRGSLNWAQINIGKGFTKPG